MSFDPWTLAFQLLNFAVLLFVLFRLVFRPVRKIMERRGAEVQAALDAAEQARAEADRIRAGMAGERERVDKARVELLGKLDGEIEEHRQRRLAGAAAEAEGLVERGRALLESERQRADEELRGRAARMAGEFSEALLRQIADPELHRALLRRFPEALAGANEELSHLTEAGPLATLVVESAFALTEEESAGLRDQIGRVVPVGGLTTSVEPGLLAGLRLRAADRVYDFSLRGQLDAQAARLKSLS